MRTITTARDVWTRRHAYEYWYGLNSRVDPDDGVIMLPVVSPSGRLEIGARRRTSAKRQCNAIKRQFRTRSRAPILRSMQITPEDPIWREWLGPVAVDP